MRKETCELVIPKRSALGARRSARRGARAAALALLLAAMSSGTALANADCPPGSDASLTMNLGDSRLDVSLTNLKGSSGLFSSCPDLSWIGLIVSNGSFSRNNPTADPGSVSGTFRQQGTGTSPNTVGGTFEVPGTMVGGFHATR